MKELWQKYLNSLSSRDRDKILYAAIEHLLEMEEIGFDEFLYWTGSGEDLLDS